MAQPGGRVFGLQRQFRGQETMLLRHSRLGAVQNVVDQLARIGEFHAATIDIASAFVVDDEQMIAPRPSGNVNVLTHL